ncbi:MAG: 1-acyl-sn-glycerol-3-phosphate acyltransferase, partial [Bacteroidales bacterium]|nr:1-acyl-sn-glycerol-3-phosphate acyltransferase [Bacteroidales bacterium]
MIDLLKSMVVWLLAVLMITVFFPVTFIVWLIVLPFDRERKIIHRLLTYQGCFLSRAVPLWKIRIEGRRRAKKGATYVIISNHQSILDILFINCLGYDFKWVSKIENTKVPVLGWYLRMADYITVDRGNRESKEKMLEKSFQCLRKGISIMIFPEGTRSVDGNIGFFKRGAFELAIKADVPLLPVVIDGTGGVLPKHSLKFKNGHRIRIKVLDPVAPESFGTD